MLVGVGDTRASKGSPGARRVVVDGERIAEARSEVFVREPSA